MTNKHTGGSYQKDGLLRVKVWDGSYELLLNGDGQLPVAIYGSTDPLEPAIGNKRVLHMDANTHALINLPYQVHELHRGHIFLYTSYKEIPGDGVMNFYIATPAASAADESEYFFRWRVRGNDEWSLKIYGSPTPDDLGNVPSSGGIIMNKLIGSSNTTDLIILENGSIGAGSKGTLIAQHYGGTGHKEGGIVSGDPFIIRAGVSFWAEIHNENAAQAAVVDWAFEWWGQTPKSEEPE